MLDAQTTQRERQLGCDCLPSVSRLGPSYFFISLVLGPLNSLLWYAPSSRYIWSSAPLFVSARTNQRHHPLSEKGVMPVVEALFSSLVDAPTFSRLGVAAFPVPKRNPNHLFARRGDVWNTRRHGGTKTNWPLFSRKKICTKSLFIALVRTVTGGGSGYAAILAHAGGVLYGMELGSVTLKRIGFFCFQIKLSTHTPRYLPLSMTDSVTLHCITLTLLGSTIKLQEPS